MVLGSPLRQERFLEHVGQRSLPERIIQLGEQVRGREGRYLALQGHVGGVLRVEASAHLHEQVV
jgi:hypothetical protein